MTICYIITVNVRFNVVRLEMDGEHVEPVSAHRDDDGMHDHLFIFFMLKKLFSVEFNIIYNIIYMWNIYQIVFSALFPTI